MEKKLITEIQRIGEIMGIKKQLLTEAPMPPWLYKILSNNFWRREGNELVSGFSKPDWGNIDRQGFKTIDLSNGEKLRISPADNRALESYLSPPRAGVPSKTYESLTKVQKEHLWKIFDEVMAREGTTYDDLYSKWVATKINTNPATGRVSELDVLKQIRDRNKNRRPDDYQTIEQFLVKERGVDPELAKRILPSLDEKIGLLEKGALTVDKDLRAISKLDPELQDFLTGYSKLTPDQVKVIAEKRKIVVEKVGEADALMEQAKRLMKNLQEASASDKVEIERALAETMRMLYNTKESAEREMDKFIQDLINSGDDELVDIGQKIMSVKKRYTKNDSWKFLNLAADQMGFLGKLSKAWGSAWDPKKLLTMEKAVLQLVTAPVRLIIRGYMAMKKFAKQLWTKSEQTVLTKELNEKLQKETPTWYQAFQRLVTGSGRGLPIDVPVVGTQKGTKTIGGTEYIDPYEELRGYGDLTFNIPYWYKRNEGFKVLPLKMSVSSASYFMEIGLVSAKWVVYDLVIGAIFPTLSFHFFGDEPDCYDELVNFFTGQTKSGHASYTYSAIVEWLTDPDLKKELPVCVDKVLANKTNLCPLMCVAARLDYMMTEDSARHEKGGDVNTFWDEMWENGTKDWFSKEGLITLSPPKVDDVYKYGKTLMQSFNAWNRGGSVPANLPAPIALDGEEAFKKFVKEILTSDAYESFDNTLKVGKSKDSKGQFRCWKYNFDAKAWIGVECDVKQTPPPTTDSLPKTDTLPSTNKLPNSSPDIQNSPKINIPKPDTNNLRDIQQRLKKKYGGK